MGKGNLITIGSFDGVHRGHQALIERTITEARKRGLKSMALTFAVPPKMVLDPRSAPRILSDAQEKERLLQQQGIDRVVCLSFNQKIAHLKPFLFFREILLRQLRAKGLVVGADFRFGTERTAGAVELVRWGQEYEIPVWIISPVRYRGQVVSSSHIRHLLETADFKRALGYLGHPYLVRGRVVRDRGVGKKLGFPTANLEIRPGKILPRGVFVVRGRVDNPKGGTFSGVCNIGVRPTFLQKPRLVMEVHVLNGKKNLAGLTLQVELLTRLRDEKKFSGPEDLKRHIANDIRRAKAFLQRDLRAN